MNPLYEWIILKMAEIEEISSVDNLLDKCFSATLDKLNQTENKELESLRVGFSNAKSYDLAKSNLLAKYSELRNAQKRIGRASFYRIKNGRSKPQRHVIEQLELALGSIPKNIKSPDIMVQMNGLLKCHSKNQQSVSPPRLDHFTGRHVSEISVFYINSHQHKIFGGVSHENTSFYNVQVNFCLESILAETLTNEPTSSDLLVEQISLILFPNESSKQKRLEKTQIAIDSLTYELLMDSQGNKEFLLIYRLVNFVGLLTQGYKQILLNIMEMLNLSQEEVAGKLNCTQNQISLILNEHIDFLGTELCLAIHILYFTSITPKTWSNLDQRQLLIDRKINPNMAMEALKVELAKFGYLEEEFIEDHHTEYTGLPYFKKSQKQEIFCDLFVKGLSSDLRIACFLRFKPGTPKQLLFYFYIAQELEATHVIFIEGASFVCLQIHCWPPSHTDIPHNISPLKYRDLSEQKHYKILDKYLASKVDELSEISKSPKEFNQLLSDFESKLDSKSLSYSDGFVSLNYQFPFVIHPSYENTLNKNLKPTIQAAHKKVYECQLMDDISRGQLNLEYSAHTFDPYPKPKSLKSESNGVVSALNNNAKSDWTSQRRR